MLKIELDTHDEVLVLEVLAMASVRYHTLVGYAEDQGDQSRLSYYKKHKTFCDELSDQIINRIGRCL